MKSGMTISRASFLGMVVVSWISIILVGGAWISYMFYGFHVESERLRERHFTTQRTLVRNEVEKGRELVQLIRRANLDALLQKNELRANAAIVLGRSLAGLKSPGMSDQDVREAVAEVVAAESPGSSGLYVARGKTVYLLSPFPDWLDQAEALSQIEEGLKGVRFGTRQLSVGPPDGLERSTLVVSVRLTGDGSMRIVSGASLEEAEEATKLEVIRRLEAIRYGAGGSLFGGTWRGHALIGPAKGKNMWEVTDVNGAKIVQELVAAAKRGGDYVSYVMPAIAGQRHTDKISYATSISDWEWYLGAGVYVDDIETTIERNRTELIQDIYYQAGIIVVGLGLLSLFALAISRRLSMRMKANIQSFTGVWNSASSTGIKIDPESLYYGEFKELAVAANHMSSERQVAEDALEQSARRFRTLVSNIPGIVYHCHNDAGWTMDFISDHVFEITGYPASNFVGDEAQPFDSIIHPDDRKWVADKVADDVKHRRPFAVEYRVVKADGEIRWLTERGRALYSEEGEPEWLDGAIFDFTDRKNAEEEYYTHLHFLETIDRVDRTMHKATDMDAMLSDALETVRQAFGSDRAWLLFPCAPDSPTFRVPMERTAPGYPGAMERDMEVPMHGEMEDVVRDALESSEPLAYDPDSGRSVPRALFEMFGVQSQLVLAVHPNLGKPWLLGMHSCREARVWSRDDQRLFKEVGRRIAEGLNAALMLSELAESEEKFRTFSEQTMLGLCVVQDNRVIFANKAYVDIFETTAEEMMSLPPGGFIKYVHPDDRKFLMEQARKKQEGDPDVVPSYVWRALTETGRVRWVEIHSRTAQVNGRNADLISLVDITDKKMAEENLEKVIADRTHDLAQKASLLEEANAHLLQLDELKSSFLTTVSHDLRTPLTSVLGFAKLVRKDLQKTIGSDGPLDKKQERIIDNLSVMETEGRRLTQLIDEFLELTAIQADTAQWDEKYSSIEKCISRAVKKSELLMEEESLVDLSLEIKGDLPHMTVDPDRFEKMLGILLDNAIKYTREGQIVVTAISPDGKKLELSVADTGKGMPEGELHAIFEPFHQVELGDTLVDEIKGSGLGLAMCRQIVKRYGGTIHAESTLGEGSTFFVSLPGDPVV